MEETIIKKNLIKERKIIVSRSGKINIGNFNMENEGFAEEIVVSDDATPEEVLQLFNETMAKVESLYNSKKEEIRSLYAPKSIKINGDKVEKIADKKQKKITLSDLKEGIT